MKCLTEKLRAWNRDTFNIFKRKRRLRIRLEGVVRALDVRASPGLLKLEGILKKEWSEVLVQEELLWMQKSRVDWLRVGDRNTKFFYMIILIRRRLNRIEMLRDEEGEWVSDSTEVKNLAMRYYKKLFCSDSQAGRGVHQRGIFVCGGQLESKFYQECHHGGDREGAEKHGLF